MAESLGRRRSVQRSCAVGHQGPDPGHPVHVDGDGVELQRDGSWARLKACRNPDCHWAYYDRSHAGRGAWCDMAVCGNRMKNRTLRSRRSGVAGTGSTQRASSAATSPNGARIQPQRTATTTTSERYP